MSWQNEEDNNRKWGWFGVVSSYSLPITLPEGTRVNTGESRTKGWGGYPNGRNGCSGGDNQTGLAGGTGFALSSTLQNGGYGAGGSYSAGGNTTSYWDQGVSGGSGGWNQGYLNVQPYQQLTVVVGAGGAASSDSIEVGSSTGGHAGGAWCNNGERGFVLIEYGGDI